MEISKFNNTTEIANEDPIIVSIKCMAYNQVKYIRQCIEGFLMQKTDFRFEILIHDDASTDGTTEIIQEYADIYPGFVIPVLETENQYKKGNKAHHVKINGMIRGKYLALCEGDDYWIDPLKLQKQVDLLESNPECKICGSNGFVYWENLTKRPMYFNTLVESKYLEAENIIGCWPMPTASLLMRTDLAFDLPEWTKRIYSGDMILMLLALDQGSVYCFSDMMVVYRRNDIAANSASQLASPIKVYSNHVELYRQFDKETDYKFHDLCEYYIKKCLDKVEFNKLLTKSVFLALIKKPLYFVKYYHSEIQRHFNQKSFSNINLLM